MDRRKQTLFSRSLAPAALMTVTALAAFPMGAGAATTTELEQRVSELQRQLDQAQRELAQARSAAASARQQAAEAQQQKEAAEQKMEAMQSPSAEVAAAEPSADQPGDTRIHIGPVTIGGATIVNYVQGDYKGLGDGPSRGGNGGNVELDNFRLTLALDYQNYIGHFEYRWYPAGSSKNYNFIHDAWLGYKFSDDDVLKVGINRVPFGPGPYGVSQSWFFDQHYYLGLADDMDLGLKFTKKIDNWTLDFGYYAMSEGSYGGTSADSARYSFDAVKWESRLDANGDVTSAATNGYEERNQFNFRAIYSFTDVPVPTDVGISLEYGDLKDKRADDGNHWAVSGHMINHWNNWTLATQITRYEYNIGNNNAWGTDKLIPLGAFDFAWLAATKAWVPAISLSYKYETPQLAWLDSVRPYVEYSRIIKDEDDFNDSDMLVVGAAWARGNWYVYSDFAYSNGNYFVGDDGDDYSSTYGVGDFGANGNDKWNYRLNLNFGYYF